MRVALGWLAPVALVVGVLAGGCATRAAEAPPWVARGSGAFSGVLVGVGEGPDEASAEAAARAEVSRLMGLMTAAAQGSCATAADREALLTASRGWLRRAEVLEKLAREGRVVARVELPLAPFEAELAGAKLLCTTATGAVQRGEGQAFDDIE